MTISEAIKHLKFSKKSYQNLIDNDTRNGEAIGKDTTGTWKANTSLANVYQTMRDTMDMAIKSLEAWEKVKADIEDKFGGCSICEWFEDYDYEENNVSEYREVGSIADIIDVIDKYKAEVEPQESEDKE